MCTKIHISKLLDWDLGMRPCGTLSLEVMLANCGGGSRSHDHSNITADSQTYSMTFKELASVKLTSKIHKIHYLNKSKNVKSTSSLSTVLFPGLPNFFITCSTNVEKARSLVPRPPPNFSYRFKYRNALSLKSTFNHPDNTQLPSLKVQKCIELKIYI